MLLTIILSGLAPKVLPQDKIITQNNDTIDCRITRVTRSDILFEVDTKGIRSAGRIPLASILSYSISPVSAQTELFKPVVSESFPRLRLGVSGGIGYIFSSSETAEESMVRWGIAQNLAEAYYKDLKTGIYGSCDVSWMLTPRIGLGFRYKFFDTSGNVEGFFDPQDGITIFYSTYSEHIYVNFAGVSLLYSEPLGSRQKLKVYCAYAAGLALYRNEAELFYGNYLVTGNSFGMDGSLGLEYFIKPGLSVGAELSAFNALLRKIEMTDGSATETLELDKENYENLSRFELSLGIRFYLWNK